MNSVAQSFSRTTTPASIDAARRPGDPGWLDAQYNNRARVAGSAELLAGWAAASAQVRERLAADDGVVLNQPYGAPLAPAGPAAQKLDIFRADLDNAGDDGAAGAPVLVYLHGGWWRALSKDDHSFIAPAFVDAGVTVVIPGYTLCPAVGIDTIARQCAAAVAWTWQHIAGFGVDPRRIVVVGHSAGGHLASLMARCRWPEVAPGLPTQLLQRAFAISGVFDLGPVARTPFLQADLRLNDAAVARLSPAGYPPPAPEDAVPVECWVGAEESAEFIWQNRQLQRAWGPQAVPVVAEMAGAHHFSVLDDLARPEGTLHRAVLRALGVAA